MVLANVGKRRKLWAKKKALLPECMRESICTWRSNTNKPEAPFCLNGLGEKRLATALIKESTNTVDRNALFRSANEYVGLNNLGATCYINAYLQVCVCYSNIALKDGCRMCLSTGLV